MLLFIILFIILLYFYLYEFNEYFNNSSNIYLSSSESYNLLINETDFFNRFNKYDFIARKIKTINDYKSIIYNSVDDFSSDEMEIINILTDEINIMDISVNWINNEKLRKIPWKFSLIKSNRLYEYSLPHTRINTIIIPKNQIKLTDDFKNTLLHEKLHVYQKMYPEDFQIYLDTNNFKKLIRYDDIKNVYRSRANPDTDEWIYIKDGEIYRAEYREDMENIVDVRYMPMDESRYEHPREKAVYDLMDKIFKNKN